jgi:ParB family transcriptional regulator, chromosome partitioning protein
MAKDKDLLQRFGANLAESMGAGRAATPAVPPPSAMGKHDGVSRLRAAAEIEVGRIVADPEQPRTEFDPGAIARLAESLKTHGQIQPISVRWSDDMGRYLIVTGERRWRASILAGRPTIAAVILEGERTESQVLEMQLVENCLREDLQPIEQARAFRTLMDRNEWTAARLAEALQLTGASVTRALALLDLPCTVQDAVASGELAPSVAYEVSKLDDPDAQREVAARVVAEGLSRAETVEAVRQVANRPARAGGSKGRGSSKPTSKLVTERTLKVDGGFKVTVAGRKGLDLETTARVLKDALDQVRAKIEPAEDQAAA